VGRNALKSWIESGIRHHYDSQLASLRSELRGSEERLKSDLRSSEATIAALRENVFAGRGQRESLLDKRRIEAVERIWAALSKLAPLRFVSELMARVDFKVAAELAPDDPKVREFAATITKNVPEMKDLNHGAADEQIFVSPLAWAYFSAYQLVLFGAYMRA